MSSQAYQGSSKRTFKQAIVHLLETEYGLVANGRIADLLAEDIHAMARHFIHQQNGSALAGWFSQESKRREEKHIQVNQPAHTSW